MALTILTTDDSKFQRNVIKKELTALLEGREITFFEASNGLEALSLLKSEKIDLMFLDLTMPEMDGYQVLGKIQEEGIDVKVIVVSADIQPKALKRVQELGAVGFVKKPMDGKKAEPIILKSGVL
ncbi:Chemotaxis protein CheC -- inhibitor of MCP methylation [hydrothermal vent metagenome]|uniref:Chemotaxis protein CheC -- inhibitor of MCP methylation n=1 Tax=hydrothermal vent metagenome TaxID=652676 RepID=A0A3B1CGZ3_9ZZZZ